MTPPPCDAAPCTTVANIQRQHCRMAELLDRLEDAFTQKAPSFVLRAVVNDLVAYSEIHLREEELLLKEGTVPGLERHFSADQQLHLRLREFQCALAPGREQLSGPARESLRSFSLHHIHYCCPPFSLPLSLANDRLVAPAA
ncbi:MAG: hemerythrin domain-containing protein [Acidobacteria bacterium]|nr:hemerythrin domain-containing protein [Acidobacteriota bacterium]